MWYRMAHVQRKYELSDRLIRAVMNWRTFGCYADEVEDLLAEGANVNEAHGTMLPLHCACMVPDEDCLNLLLRRGAEVNAIDGYGRTALHYAAERDVTCVEVLLDFGADVNATDTNLDTPLHWASFKNKADCMLALITHGADVNCTDMSFDTPLSWAATHAKYNAVRLLLKYNANPLVVNRRGETPLLRAAKEQAREIKLHEVHDNDTETVALLVSACGQVDLRNQNTGRLPPSLERRPALLQYLMQVSTSVCPLKKLCRATIRSSLPSSVHLRGAVNELPLPTQLKQFLLLREVN